MAKVPFSIDLKEVDLGSLKTDEDFRKEAERLYPGVVQQLAQHAAEAAWSGTQSALKNVPDIKLNQSGSEKAKFVRDAAKGFELDAAGSETTLNAIVAKLRELKADS